MRVVRAGKGEGRAQWLRRGLALSVLALLIAAGADVARAQTLYGSLSGTVTEPAELPWREPP